jgi:hypothetical protein
MRSRLAYWSFAAWLAVSSLAMVQPMSALAMSPDMVMLCTGGGVKWVRSPTGGRHKRDDPCGKPCHAMCQRKRVGLEQNEADEEPA